MSFTSRNTFDLMTLSQLEGESHALTLTLAINRVMTYTEVFRLSLPKFTQNNNWKTLKNNAHKNAHSTYFAWLFSLLHYIACTIRLFTNHVTSSPLTPSYCAIPHRASLLSMMFWNIRLLLGIPTWVFVTRNPWSFVSSYLALWLDAARWDGINF